MTKLITMLFQNTCTPRCSWCLLISLLLFLPTRTSTKKIEQQPLPLQVNIKVTNINASSFYISLSSEDIIQFNIVISFNYIILCFQKIHKPILICCDTFETRMFFWCRSEPAALSLFNKGRSLPNKHINSMPAK